MEVIREGIEYMLDFGLGDMNYNPTPFEFGDNVSLLDTPSVPVDGSAMNWGNIFSSVDALDSSTLFPITTSPSGVYDIESRSSSWWDYDQSKITASLQDVLGSVVQAGAKSAVQKAADSINTGSNNKNPTIAEFFRNFSSTKTGAQVQAGAMGTRALNIISNPILWLVLVGGTIAFFVLRKK